MEICGWIQVYKEFLLFTLCGPSLYLLFVYKKTAGGSGRERNRCVEPLDLRRVLYHTPCSMFYDTSSGGRKNNFQRAFQVIEMAEGIGGRAS